MTMTEPALAWDSSLEVGNAVIDRDHKETVELLAALIDAPDTDFPTLFTGFAAHLRAHLANEEALMREYGFPAYAIHRHEHERVRTELEGIERRLAAGNLMLARGYATEIVPDWFLAHKDTMDAATAAWIRQQGG
ncbi:hemerythrin family protein [Azospirillum sp. RWY-5-1]|uniref:Hemerythrin family protein n=1 Tax=Azospirillum oleiclasticum TaxID=2735135 RepID=A0ABX2THD7_9PROT|nr:hemerythrin family protein [Azospirillum oleiclasticum]NYZ16185.1 hemerythrin family protein [Azospirillum oleiclasticum]NYZ23671.1 hemerythrin family protein [Azospirillum oleiclasticum]